MAVLRLLDDAKASPRHRALSSSALATLLVVAAAALFTLSCGTPTPTDTDANELDDDCSATYGDFIDCHENCESEEAACERVVECYFAGLE